MHTDWFESGETHATAVPQRQSDLIRGINTKASELTISSLSAAGTEDFADIGYNLNNLEELHKRLSYRLLENQRDSYQKSIVIVEKRF